jgi:hypothetical protein
MLYFAAVIPLLAEESNCYYHQYFDKQDEEPSLPLPNLVTSEMFLILALITQMGCNVVDSLKDYWSTMEKFYMPFYNNTTKCNRFLHILHFPNFTDNNEQPERNYENYDTL